MTKLTVVISMLKSGATLLGLKVVVRNRGMNIATAKASTESKYWRESASSSSTTVLAGATVAPPEIRVREKNKNNLKEGLKRRLSLEIIYLI